LTTVRPSRLRPILFAVLVALIPTAVAAWAIGRSSTDGARHDADTEVRAEVQSASLAYGDIVADARAEAGKVAKRPEVQRALVRRDLPMLRQFAREHRAVAFYIRGRRIPARAFAGGASGNAVVTLGGRGVGTVVYHLPKARVLKRLREDVPLTADDSLFLLPPGTASSRPSDVRVGNDTYRAAGVDARRYSAVVGRPRSVIDDDVGNRWLLIALAALVTLATIGLVAWAAMPLITRKRIVQRERTEALHVLGNVRDGVFYVDADGSIRFWNRSAERITGLAREHVFGRKLNALPGFASLGERIPVGEEGVVRPLTLPVQLGTRELWLSLSGVRNEDGIVYTFADVTEEERLEQLKSDFLSTVSHELRTPLAGLYGAAVTLQERGERLTGSVRAELLATLSDQAEHLVRVVEDVLVASGLESDRLTIVQQRFDAVALAEIVVEDARLRHNTHRVQVEEAEEVYALADPGRTRQVLENLIDNALKYAPHGLVRVAVERGEGTVVFSVSDEGPGIAETDRDRIFDKFYRSDVQMKGGIGGTGLGLYICRELVNRMGGRLWLDSTPGAGSLFLFELPSVLADRVPELEAWGGPSSV
jgi:signal transduction histidine kinase